MTTLKIAPRPDGLGHIIEVDGYDIADVVTGLTIHGQAYPAPCWRVTLDLGPLGEVDLEAGGEVAVEMGSQVRDALTRLGWTPPVEADR